MKSGLGVTFLLQVEIFHKAMAFIYTITLVLTEEGILGFFIDNLLDLIRKEAGHLFNTVFVATFYTSLSVYDNIFTHDY